jgi:hypothetical protein
MRFNGVRILIQQYRKHKTTAGQIVARDTRNLIP